MINPVGLAILVCLAGLLIASLWAIAGPPKRITLALAGLAFGIFTWQAVGHLNGHLHCDQDLSTVRRRAFATTSDGEQVVRVEPLRQIRGIRIRVARNDGADTDYAALESCGWNARDARGPVPIAGGSKYDLLDIEDEFAWIDLGYSVDETTRPLLASHHLEITAPRIALKGDYVYRDVYRYGVYVFTAAALLALAGIVIQMIRFERSRRHRASQAA